MTKQVEQNDLATTHERRFFDLLGDLFIGVTIEGQSGYVNLMKIKSQYYRQVMEPSIRQFVQDQTAEFPEYREDLYTKLYTFLKRYIHPEIGSLGLFFTPYHESVYERVYTDDRDVMLFWKTSRLYYIKTDILFRSMDVEIEGYKFRFDASQVEHKRNNEKRKLAYRVSGVQGNQITFAVQYQESNHRGRDDDENGAKDASAVLKDILNALKQRGVSISESVLEKAIRDFEKQSKVDFFICKDARSFLREQFDLWMWQYLLGAPGSEPDTEFDQTNLRKLQALKRVAYKIIDFIAVFEDELVKIWNKPRFVLNSNYVITIDRIWAKSQEMVHRLLEHPGMEKQVQEWRDLGMVDESFSACDILKSDSLIDGLHSRYRFLPLDTKYFKDVELEILGLFDNLDDELDGWLIKSENYQALNTILPKWRGKVKCIYIDPPYNTGNDEFLYVDSFRRSSWMTMMSNRLQVAKDFLSSSGGLLVSIDYNEDASLRFLLESLFGGGQYRNTIVVSRVKKSVRERALVKSLNWGTGYVLFFSASEETRIKPPVKQKGESGGIRWHSFDAPGIRPTMDYDILGQRPPAGRHWMFSEERARAMIEEGTIRQNPRTGRIEYRVPESEGVILDTNWTDLLESDPTEDFPTSKNPLLLQRALSMLLEADSVVLDYFAGSGTTAVAVMNLNRQDDGKRKYILIEMSDYFYTVLLPRIKRSAFSDRYSDGKAAPDGKGFSQFVKYFSLESYEDTLIRAHFRDKEVTGDVHYLFRVHPEIVFLQDAKLLDNAETGMSAALIDVDGKEVTVDLTKLYPDIDLIETISCLVGQRIRRVMGGEGVLDDGTVVPANPARATQLQHLIKPLLWW